MKAVIPDNVQHLQSIYDEDGRYLGSYVDCLTDGPDLSRGSKGGRIEAGWTMGELRPSTAEDSFQRLLWNNKRCWGLRTVFHRVHGVVEQACVQSITGNECVWINL